MKPNSTETIPGQLLSGALGRDIDTKGQNYVPSKSLEGRHIKKQQEDKPPTSQGEESEKNRLGDTFILDF